MALLSGTTWASRYQKKQSPTHTHPDHRTSFINFLHLLRSIASSLFSLRVWLSLRCCTNTVLLSYTSLVMALVVLCCCRGSCYGCRVQTWQCCICQLHSNAGRHAFIRTLSLVLVLLVLRSGRQPGGVHEDWRLGAAEGVAETRQSRWQWHHRALAAGRNPAQFPQLHTQRGARMSLLCSHQSTITRLSFSYQLAITSSYCSYQSFVFLCFDIVG